MTRFPSPCIESTRPPRFRVPLSHSRKRIGLCSSRLPSMANTRAKPESVPQTVPTAKSQSFEPDGHISGTTHPQQTLREFQSDCSTIERAISRKFRLAQESEFISLISRISAFPLYVTLTTQLQLRRLAPNARTDRAISPGNASMPVAPRQAALE